MAICILVEPRPAKLRACASRSSHDRHLRRVLGARARPSGQRARLLRDAAEHDEERSGPGQSGRYARLAPVVDRVFDIPLMTRLAHRLVLGNAPSAQQQQLTEAFRALYRSDLRRPIR